MRPEAVNGLQGCFVWPLELHNVLSLRISHENFRAGCFSVGLNDSAHRRIGFAVFKLWELVPGPTGQYVRRSVLTKWFKSAGTMELKVTLLPLDDANYNSVRPSKQMSP